MQFVDIIQTLAEVTLLKIIASLIVGFLFLFGDFHTQGIIAVLMLMTFDTILGVSAAWHQGTPITSRRFSRVVQKGIVYLMAISAGYFTDIAIDWHIAQATMVGFIAVTEFISILEKMGNLGYETPNKLLNQLKDFKSSK